MNENSEFRHQGERIAVLEQGYKKMEESLMHLHDCMHQVKDDATKRDKVWDRRWSMGIGIIIGVCLITGSGTISLKHLIEFLTK